MPTREQVTVRIGGQEFKVNASPEEKRHIERATKRVTDTLAGLQEVGGGVMSPAKIATMAAFQLAFDLSVADAMLDEAQRLEGELERQREAVAKLEGLLSRVDEALAY